MLGTNLKCDPCGKVFTGDACYQQHVASEKHKKKVAQFGSSGSYVGSNSCSNNQSFVLSQDHDERSVTPDSTAKCSESEGNYCKVCNLGFHNWHAYIQHICSIGHSKKVMSGVSGESKVMEQPVLNSELPSTKTATQLEFYCELCDCKCNSVIQFQQHIQNLKHQKKQLAVSGGNELCLLNSPAGTLGDNLPDSSCGVNASTSNYICRVCNISCTGPEPYEQHLKSMKHVKKLHSGQNENVLLGNNSCMDNSSYAAKSKNCVMTLQTTWAENSSYLRCEPCGKIFSGNIPYSYHLKSTGHQKKTRLLQLKNFEEANSSTDGRNFEEANSSTDSASTNTSEIDDEVDYGNSDICSPVTKSISDGIKIYAVEDLNIKIFLPEDEVTFDNLPSVYTKMDH